jgi:hypothetical protein
LIDNSPPPDSKKPCIFNFSPKTPPLSFDAAMPDKKFLSISTDNQSREDASMSHHPQHQSNAEQIKRRGDAGVSAGL